MCIRFQLLFLLVALTFFTSCKTNREKTDPGVTITDTTLKFEPNWESIKKNYKDPKWFNEAKFGIFIHWGVY